MIELPNTQVQLGDGGDPLVNVTMLYDNQSVVNIGDFNFDGMEDVAICDGPNGSYGGPSYQVYLSSRSAGKFVHNAAFSELGQNLGMFEVDKTKVKVSDRGTVEVNEYYETAEPGIYAIGDVVATAQLAHLASKEGILVVEKIAGKKVQPIKHNLVPNCTYCDPEVASVGLTEAKAKEAGYDVKIGKFPFSASGKARILGETDGFVKIVSEKKYDEVLGVHIIGPHATELLAEACVAMALETTADELGRVIHAHPTVSESVMEAAEGVHDLTIHM